MPCLLVEIFKEEFYCVFDN